MRDAVPTTRTADVDLFAPDAAFDEARRSLPGLPEQGGVSDAAALATLDERWSLSCAPSISGGARRATGGAHAHR